MIRFGAATIPLGTLVLLFACGNQQTVTSNWTLEDLTADQGFSVRVGPFDVPLGHESQRCYFMRVPDLGQGQSIWLERVKIANNPGTHHVNVFRVRTIKNLGPENGTPVKIGPYDGTLVDGRDDSTYNMDGRPASICWDSSNWSDWPLVANSQNSEASNPYLDWHLPNNVGLKLEVGEWLMIQTHYVNVNKQLTTIGAYTGINFYVMKNGISASGLAPIEMGTLFATQQAIRICQSKPEVTFSGTCPLPKGDVRVAAANGHFHSRGKQFRIYSWDGTSEAHPDPSAQFYESDNWNDPPMLIDLNVQIPANGGVWWDCEYQWRAPVSGCDVVNAKDHEHQNDCCYTFGGNTDVGEHCNVFVYYYPKGPSDVFCN